MSDVSHCPRWVTTLQDARCTKFVLKGPGLEEFRTGWPSENALNIALDGIDAKILGRLHGDGRMTHSEVARRLGLAEATVRKWVGRGPENGVIQFQAWVDPLKVGYDGYAIIDALGALRAPARRVTPPFTPVPFSPPMENFWLPDATRIATAVREVLR